MAALKGSWQTASGAEPVSARRRPSRCRRRPSRLRRLRLVFAAWARHTQGCGQLGDATARGTTRRTDASRLGRCAVLVAMFCLISAVLPTVITRSVAMSFAHVQASSGAGPAEAASESLTQRYTQGPLTVAVRLSPPRPSVADAVQVDLSVTADQEVEARLPDLSDLKDAFQVRELARIGPVIDRAGRWSWRLVFEVEVLRPGEYQVPALPIRYRHVGQQGWQTVRTRPLGLRFSSVLARGSDAPMPAPGPLPWPRPPSRSSLPHLAALGLLVVAAAALALVRIRRRTPASDYHHQALQELDRIAAKPVHSPQDSEQICNALGQVLRLYVGRRWDVPALARTSDELLESLRGRTGLEGEQHQQLQWLLHECDRGKFAGVCYSASQCGCLVQTARRFLQATAPAGRARPLNLTG